MTPAAPLLRCNDLDDSVIRMCANFIPARPAALHRDFGVAPSVTETNAEAFPGQFAPIIRRRPGPAGSAKTECVAAMFGMVPHWAEVTLARSTYNARTETVATKPSFRNAWKNGQFCIVPAEVIFEPSYATGKAVRWGISHAGEQSLAVAGIWESRAGDQDRQPLLSFSMLTINADDHSLMRQFHRPGDEKRMLVFLEPDEYAGWLETGMEAAGSFLTQYSPDRLVALPAPRVVARRSSTLPTTGSLF